MVQTVLTSMNVLMDRMNAVGTVIALILQEVTLALANQDIAETV